MKRPPPIGWEDTTQQELAYLALNKHLTTEAIKNSIAHWEAKYENTDAYGQSMQYLDKAAGLKRLLATRKKWGIL